MALDEKAVIGTPKHSRLAEDLLGAMAVAMRSRDWKGVLALWKMLAIEDPDTAAELLEIVRNAP